jgi:diguanylate cyclase (GGDEF)-like protein
MAGLLLIGATAAIEAGHRLTAVILLLAGYAASAVWHRWRCRAAVAEARRDPLTGLPNRAPADEALARATHNHAPMTVALIDVDGLHALNASLGHAAGDQYLTAVADRLSTAVPPGGLLARQGGDEFTLLAPEAAPAALATAIGTALPGPATIAGRRLQSRASVGVAATGGPDGRDAHHARACADAAMYSAKAAGGNHVLIYHPERDGVPDPDGTRPLRRRRGLAAQPW